MNIDINDIRFTKCREWLKCKRQEKSYNWDQLKLAGQSSEEDLYDFLSAKKKFDDWPKELDIDIWYQIVEEYHKVQESSFPIKYNTEPIMVSDIEEQTYIGIPKDSSSCWQLYREHLIANGFGQEIDMIEKSCLSTLKRLRDNTKATGPIKGLVVGNVQSGKTANMAGLMAMAADYGWNMFIILSGTIESLRKQTQDRFCNDLQGLNSKLTWVGLEHLSPTASSTNQISHLNLSPTSHARYYTVCLKVKTRLEDLIDWIQSDPNKLDQLRILVIDDEADQASINTYKMSEDEKEEEKKRKEINRLIINLVHCRSKKSKKSTDASLPVRAMNYISYTATPYANCLNESGDNTLYPKHFIHCLVPSKKYIGPFQMYKAGDNDKPILEITRTISSNDVKNISSILKKTSKTIPPSLEESLLWFIISAACMRCYNSKKPVSMLVHLSRNQADHKTIAELITTWFDKKRNSIVDLCRPVYEKETKLFSKKSFRDGYIEYARKDEEIPDYPPFEKLIPHIKDLIKEVSHIKMTESNTPKYNKSIHLCIDNCKNNGLTEEGEHIRLIYPDSEGSNKPNFSTAFIVIGGNTLARGLTLQGLTSTYFHRDVLQADTLMQMARWFGYKINYELLPRVWMSSETKEKFDYLTDLDDDLRYQLYLLQDSGMKPLDFQISFKASPKTKFLLTSKNKMQGAVTSEVDCSGLDTQLTTYCTDSDVLKNNLEITEKFIKKLGGGHKSDLTSAYYWDDVEYSIINKNFFKHFNVHKTSRSFQDFDLINDWVLKETQKGNMSSWSVICAGIKPNEQLEKNWVLPNGFILGKIERTPKWVYADHISIGTLSSKKDYLSDVRKSMFDDATWQLLQKESNFSSNYRFYRKQAGLDKKPILVLYMIDKNSNEFKKNKLALSLENDLIGVAMITPGIREQKNIVKTRFKIKHIEDIEENVEY